MQIPILNGNRFYVYEHIRRDTGAVFYVGKGTGYRATNASRHHRSTWWQRVVASAGGFDARFVARDVDEELAFLVEIERIDQWRRRGARLCNMTNGGDGTSGWMPTQEWREKIGAAHRGKVTPPEVRQKISRSIAATGYKHSDESRAKIARAHIGHRYNVGRQQPAEEKQRRAVSLKGNKSRTGQKRSEAERLATSLANAGRPQPILTCPHCGKSGGNAMRRWHFDACKGATK